MCLTTRPQFPDSETYLQHVQESRLARLRYWGPATVDELVALKTEMPDIYSEFKPSEHDLAMIVKSCRLWSSKHGNEHLAEAADTLEHDPAPQSDVEFDRLLLKLTEDAEANAALLAVLSGGPAL